MTEWPEPVREPGETPRWLGWTIAALVFGGLLWAVRDDAPAIAWRMPEFAMPEIALPEIEWPDFGETDPAGQTQAQPQPAPPDMADAANVAEARVVVPGVAFDMPAVPGLPFEACLEIANEAASGLAALSVVESSNDRRVIRFKTLEGGLTITCSRADGMQIERR